MCLVRAECVGLFNKTCDAGWLSSCITVELVMVGNPISINKGCNHSNSLKPSVTCMISDSVDDNAWIPLCFFEKGINVAILQQLEYKALTHHSKYFVLAANHVGVPVLEWGCSHLWQYTRLAKTYFSLKSYSCSSWLQFAHVTKIEMPQSQMPQICISKWCWCCHQCHLLTGVNLRISV